MKKNKPVLNIVIPCYNEEEALPITKKVLETKMTKLIKDNMISKDSKVVLVNDGSKDNTWDLISKIHNENDMFVGIKLSRNKGHQNALLAGLMYAKDHCDISISMDADLQDDINVIDDMIKKYNDGCEIVYGVRSSRKKDSFFKRFTAESFYKLMNAFGVEVVFNHADCRLMSKRALEELAKYKEVNLFLRGIVPQIGFKTAISYYERNNRVAGVSKYPLKKMLAFAMDGITSFSIKPLKMIFSLGIILLLASIIYLILALIFGFPSWNYIICAILFVGAIQIICLGIIGEYIGKNYIETKSRPRYIVETILD